MKVDFRNKRLIELYTKGTSRKYKISEQVLKKFFLGIRALESAKTIYDLWNTPSLKFEKLEGFENRYSIRLTQKITGIIREPERMAFRDGDRLGRRGKNARNDFPG